MIRLLKVCVALALIWSLYWMAAGYGVRRAVAGWFEQRSQLGWRAEYGDSATTGYPLRHVTTLAGPALADPRTGVAWQADWLSIDSPAIWPGYQTLRFPATAQRLSYFDQSVAVFANDLIANLKLRPGAQLELQEMAVTSGPWQVVGDTGPDMSAQALILAMTQTQLPEQYDIKVDADAFSPGPRLRDLMSDAHSLPDSFDALHLDMSVAFSRPWDMTAVEQDRPQPRMINLKLAELGWGDLRFLAAGRVEVDTEGLPTGAVTIKADNWRDILNMAHTAGTIPTAVLGPVEKVLGLLAGLSSNPDALDIELKFGNGKMAVGPFPIGPAPRLILR